MVRRCSREGSPSLGVQVFNRRPSEIPEGKSMALTMYRIQGSQNIFFWQNHIRHCRTPTWTGLGKESGDRRQKPGGERDVTLSRREVVHRRQPALVASYDPRQPRWSLFFPGPHKGAGGEEGGGPWGFSAGCGGQEMQGVGVWRVGRALYRGGGGNRGTAGGGIPQIEDTVSSASIARGAKRLTVSLWVSCPFDFSALRLTSTSVSDALWELRAGESF
ncbi:hypothetical protein PoB_006782200 [Plakobranchus ocellatus]|uniref:Uncharacterized protein n=1 Tax=Plakobranchus ocellatus TaxID=259542 RepID=A0AAV4DBC1_9GAST|nr:hypothetical protein PoB_006782200 [Plakobranchus ocellatus]